MSKNSRTEKARVTESADFGAYFLILAVVAVGALAYFSEDFGPRWAKVIEIVGAPFSLGLGFFAFCCLLFRRTHKNNVSSSYG